MNNFINDKITDKNADILLSDKDNKVIFSNSHEDKKLQLNGENTQKQKITNTIYQWFPVQAYLFVILRIV